jgi:metallo-beta-lactamase family protein
MKLQFLGAAGTVTGSKTLVTASGRQLLVDCGLFQGYKNLRLLNWEALPFDPKQLDAVVLTHAHLDHSGALPLLVKQGYKGPIFATPSTIDVCNILLPDSARLQEEDAEYNNRHHRSKHKIAQPLYTVKDADLALRQLVPLPFEEQIDAAGLRVRLRLAGHIVGASSVELASAATTILFSGDLGRSDDPIMQQPSPIARADYVVVESTYGDRLHDAQDPQVVLGEVIKRTAARGGIVLVPAFAVGRAQEVLYAIYRLKALGSIPNVPVYLNSPMAIDMTEVYQRYRREHRLSIEECKGMCQVAQMVSTVEDSRALVAQKWPAVVVSASGMATGGRVLHHLKALAPHPRNTIVFAGFQAGGTRGGRIVAGERSIRIFGEEVAVNAEVVSLAGMSAHADAQQIMQWLATAPRAPKAVYLNHGEPAAADALRQRIEHEFGWPAVVPRFNQCVEIEP